MIFLNIRRYISILSFLFISLFFSNLVIGQEENTETQNNTPVINETFPIAVVNMQAIVGQSLAAVKVREFIENIWAHSYDNPQYFKAWHVSLLAEDIEECLAEGLNYVGILPRGHFKSTILGKGIFLIMINGNKDRNPNKNLKNTRL